MLVQELMRLQHDHGYLSDAVLKDAAERLQVPLYRLEELVSFFPHFRRSHPPAVEVQVCRDMSCHLRGSAGVCDGLRAAFEGDREVHIEEVSCLGRCDRAVASLVNERPFVQGSVEKLQTVVEDTRAGRDVEPDWDEEHPDYPKSDWKIEVYPGESPDYRAVRRFLASPEPDAADRVLKALEVAGLLGMGGAGGRAFKKWNDVREAKGDQKFVVCNADESEPGTFKDRELLLRYPHLIIEGMVLGGLVVGAEQGYVYIRHEYGEQIDRMRQAIGEANRLGVCGDDVLGSGRRFQMEVFVSPGGYICGEQTALIEAMEDQRGEPRNRPPELATNGLWDCPTLLNNVETLAWVPAIMLQDEGEWFARQGKSERFKGRRLFSISGDVKRPGVYEVPSGITFGELLQECGGAQGRLKAVALSGPSGGFLPAQVPVDQENRITSAEAAAATLPIEDLVLDIGTSRGRNYMLGAGIVVYNDTRDMVEEALACLRFFRNESCGKCVPCRIGSQKLVELAERLEQKQASSSDLQVVEPLGATMRETSICGLGQIASNPFVTLLRHFSDDVRTALP